MATSALLVSVCFLVVTFLMKRKISNLAVLFNLIWSVLILISIIGFIGINKPSDEVYGIFCKGTVSFNVAYIVLSIICVSVKKNRHSIKPTTMSVELLRERIISIIQIILLVYYSVKLVGVIEYVLNTGSYESIRSYYYSDQFLSSIIEYLFITYLFDPMITVTIILFSFNLFDRKYRKTTLALMAVNIVLRAFISGGRTILFEFVVILIMAYLAYFKDVRTIKLRQKVILTLFCAVVTLFAVIISFGRDGKTDGIISTIIEMLAINFTGSFKYLSILLERDLFLPDRTYGAASFAGIYDVFISISRFFGMENAETLQNSIGNITAKFWYIGNYSYNAMPTMYYFFITDWGKTGPIIGGAVFAAIACFAEKLFVNKRTYKYFAVYLLVVLIVAESTASWLPFKSSFIMAVVYSLLLFNNTCLPKRS